MANQQGRSRSFYLHCFIGILLMFGPWVIPPFEPVTPIGMRILGIFLGLIYMWTFVGSLWPSLLGIMAMAASGYMSMNEALAGSFANSSALIVLFTLILFGAVENAGVAQYVAQWFLTRRIINGRPLVFSLMFFVATYLLCSLIGPVAGLLFMWPIVYNILKQVGYKSGDAYATIMVIGTFIAAVLGQGTIPFKSSPLVILSAYSAVSAAPIPYFQYIVFAVVMALLTIGGYVLLTTVVIKPDMSLIKNISADDFAKTPLPPMNRTQKIYFAILWLYMLSLLIPNMLPATWPVIAFINKFGVIGMTLTYIIILCLIQADGQPIFNFKQMAGRYLTWDIYFLVAAAQVVSSALTSQQTGIKEFIVMMLDPLFGGRSVLTFSIILIIFSILITNVAANAVMGIVLMPVVYIFASTLGANAAALAVIVTISLHVAMLTPAASPVAAILHGNKEWVATKDIYRYCGIVVVATILIYALVGIPLANMLF